MNSIDDFLDNAIEIFSQIPNFNLVNLDPKANAQFEFLVSENSALLDLKVLFLNNYIPVAEKHVQNSKEKMLKSKYSFLLKDMLYFADESYWETIRLGYVALFHRYENFIHNLLKTCIYVYDLPFENKNKFDTHLKEEFGFNLMKNYRYTKFLHQINWICISVKHYDSFPNPNNKPRGLDTLPDNEKIKIPKEVLVKHFEIVFFLFENISRIIFALSAITSDGYLDNKTKKEFKKMIDNMLNMMK